MPWLYLIFIKYYYQFVNADRGLKICFADRKKWLHHDKRHMDQHFIAIIKIKSSMLLCIADITLTRKYEYPPFKQI